MSDLKVDTPVVFQSGNPVFDAFVTLYANKAYPFKEDIWNQVHDYLLKIYAKEPSRVEEAAKSAAQAKLLAMSTEDLQKALAGK